MHCSHCHSDRPVRAHDEAEVLGQNLRKGIGETLQVLNAGSQVLRTLLHGIIWNEWGMASHKECGHLRGCHGTIHHYCIHCRPTPCPCHGCM